VIRRNPYNEWENLLLDLMPMLFPGGALAESINNTNQEDCRKDHHYDGDNQGYVGISHLF